MPINNGNARTSGITERIVAHLKREQKGLIGVLKSHGFFIAIGLGLGIGLIILPHQIQWFENHALIALVIEHLGLGFLVSSIAVFGYEWRSHTKMAVELSEKLAKILTERGKEALKLSLFAVLGEKEDSESLRDSIIELIDAITVLQQQQTWMKDQHVDVIKWLLTEVVLKNAKAFEKLNEGGERPFIVPTSVQMADEILAAQMKAMNRGDTYDTISDISIWRSEQLEKFKTQQLGAIYRGVKVRRIFNLYRLNLSETGNLAHQQMRDELIEILKDHLKWSEPTAYGPTNKRPGYEVRIFWKDEMKQLKAHAKAKADSLETDVREAHYGLFKRGKPETIIRFKVEESDLSDMRMSQERDLIKSDLKLFEDMWKRSPQLNDDQIKKIKVVINGSKEISISQD